MKNFEIVKLFDKYKKSPEMQTEYYMDGCIQRTGKILSDLEEQGQKSSLLVCLGMPENIKSKEYPAIKWHQHFAPIVFDEKGKAVVLDICLMDGPEYFDEYKKHFENIQIFMGPNDGAGVNFLENFSIENYAQKLNDIAKKEKNQKNKIIPNAIKSKWMQEYNEEFALKNKLISQSHHHS